MTDVQRQYPKQAPVITSMQKTRKEQNRRGKKNISSWSKHMQMVNRVYDDDDELGSSATLV
jgi:hypothetical protein